MAYEKIYFKKINYNLITFIFLIDNYGILEKI